MRIVTLYSLLAAILHLALNARAATYVVSPAGTGDFPVIQDAIAAASNGDVILLTSGTFRGAGNRDLDFLGKAITVRSDGGVPQDCIVDCEGSYAEPHRGFTFHCGEDTTSVVMGITITMGVGHVGEGGHYYGGAFYCTGSSPAIRDCIVDRNYASMGGGVYCTGGSSAVFSGCVFRNNSGAGASSRYGPVLRFRDCAFIENWNSSKGGGLFTREAAVNLTRCSFLGNVSASDGGGAFLWFSEATITDCSFDANEAYYGGGGLNADAEQPPVLTGCGFTGNVAYYGGGIRLEWCPAILTDCVFQENEADAGGGIYTINGMPILTRCTVAGNSAAVGGGVACCGSPSFNNCTIAGNHAPEAGGIYCWRDQSYGWAEPVFENTLIAFNGSGQALLCAHDPDITLSCCDIYGNAGGDWTGLIAGQFGVSGNICVDPLFCGELHPEEPFTLHALSPCAQENSPACGQIGAWPVGCGWETLEEGGLGQATGVSLSACRPNPSQGEATVSYLIPTRLGTRPVRLSVVDSAGRLVRVLVDGEAQVGANHSVWRGEDHCGQPVPAGVYFADLRIGCQQLKARVVLLR